MDMIHKHTGIWREHVSEGLSIGMEQELIFPFVQFSIHVYIVRVQPRQKG